LDERTSIEILEDVRALRGSYAPIEMKDLLGNSIYGYVTSVTEQPTYRNSIDEDEEENIEYWLHCNFVAV